MDQKERWYLLNLISPYVSHLESCEIHAKDGICSCGLANVVREFQNYSLDKPK